jgi:hypothetical protein
MKKVIFKILAKANKLLLPRYSKRDISKLSKLDKALVAFRYWVTVNALDNDDN